MSDDTTRGDSPPRILERLADLSTATSRREFLRILGLGGTIALLPGAAACDDSFTDPVSGIPGSGDPVLIDFAQGDVAVLQLASVLEQIEAEFYSRVVAAFATSNIASGEQAVLTEIRDHELAHRAFLEGTLGADAAVPVRPTFPGVSFTDRVAVLTAAWTLEDLGIAMYNGAAQYLTSPATLLELAKIASVEGRHASTLRDLQQPRTNFFSQAMADEAWRPTKSATAMQDYLVQKLGFANVPATFIPGPNGSG